MTSFYGEIDADAAGALRARGWVAFNLDAGDESVYRSQLEQLAKQLGEPAHFGDKPSTITTLRPTPSEEAKPRSLSRQFSLGEFPFHVDTAHWVTPCRYVLMGCLCPGAGKRPSLLLDTRNLELTPAQVALLEQTPLRIRNGKHSFFGTVLRSGRQFVRYDPGCMEAICANGERALAFYSNAAWADQIVTIEWERGKTLVIDNWRVLHARGAALTVDLNRTLLRALVK